MSGERERLYTARVEQVAAALHEDCRLAWQAQRVVSPGVQVTQHSYEAHYLQAHSLVRRLWPELDTAAVSPSLDVERLARVMGSTGNCGRAALEEQLFPGNRMWHLSRSHDGDWERCWHTTCDVFRVALRAALSQQSEKPTP